MPELSNIIGWVIIIIISLIGWVQTSKNAKSANKKAEQAVIEAAKIAREAVTQQIQRIEHTLNDLPCEKNRNYELDFGKLLEKVSRIEKMLESK